MRVVLLITVACLAGCSPSARIAQSSVGIAALAHSSKQRFATITEQVDSRTPDLYIVRDMAVGGEGEQDQIIEGVSAIVAALPGVQDTTPWWASAIVGVLACVAILGICFVLGQSGVLSTFAGVWRRWFPA